MKSEYSLGGPGCLTYAVTLSGPFYYRAPHTLTIAIFPLMTTRSSELHPTWAVLQSHVITGAFLSAYDELFCQQSIVLDTCSIKTINTLAISLVFERQDVLMP